MKNWGWHWKILTPLVYLGTEQSVQQGCSRVMDFKNLRELLSRYIHLGKKLGSVQIHENAISIRTSYVKGSWHFTAFFFFRCKFQIINWNFQLLLLVCLFCFRSRFYPFFSILPSNISLSWWDLEIKGDLYNNVLSRKKKLKSVL